MRGRVVVGEYHMSLVHCMMIYQLYIIQVPYWLWKITNVYEFHVTE